MPTLDYQSPEPPAKPKAQPHGGCVGGCLGAVMLGIVAPFLFALYCGLVLNDMGGPLFWPIISAFGGVVGLLAGTAIGAIIHVVRKKRASS